MMRRYMPLAIAALVFGVAIAAGATVTQAQVAPAPVTVTSCDITRYDLTGDGALSKSDILTWLERVESEGCPLGGSAEGRCGELDMDGDGVLSFDDARTMFAHFQVCVNKLGISALPRRR